MKKRIAINDIAKDHVEQLDNEQLSRVTGGAWELQNAYVTSYSIGGGGQANAVPTEQLSLNYEKIVWRY